MRKVFFCLMAMMGVLNQNSIHNRSSWKPSHRRYIGHPASANAYAG